MSQSILEVKNLNVTLGDQQIIKDLSFVVEAKENLVVLGPNGVGKTTLFRAVLGLIPYSGEVKWSQNLKIAYLPSQELLSRDNQIPLKVMEFFDLKNVNLKQIKKIIKEIGLTEDILEKPFNKLSTGQFQRMIIAWTLVDEPQVLLFDEPTSGIDVAGQKTIYSLLHKFWQTQDLTILMITHDLNIVWEHANHVLCLGANNMCYGAPKKVLQPTELEKIYGTGIKFYEHKHF